MILEDVTFIDKVENETQTPPFYRSRIMKITTDLNSFSTPARVTTRSEHHARSLAPLSRTVPLDLAIDFRELTDNQVLKFNDDDGKVSAKLVRLARQFNDITTDAIFRISVFQPPDSVLAILSDQKKIKFAESQAEFLQSRLGSNMITYPYLDLPVTDYKAFIDAHYLRTENASTIFFFDMAMDSNNLRGLIDHIVKKEQPAIVGLKYRKWEDSIPQHRVVASFFNNQRTAFFAAQVEREEPDTHVSNLHSVAFEWGLDFVSLNQPRGHPNKQKLNLNKIRMIDPNSLVISNIEHTLADSNRNILGEFDIPLENFNDISFVQRVLRGYRGAKVHPKKFQTLFRLARTHEAITSCKAFDTSREKIPEKEQMKDYIDHTGLKLAPLALAR